MAETTVTTEQKPLALIKRAVELYRDGGTERLKRGAEEYLRINTPLLEKPQYQDRRIDNERRWEYIETHIEPEHESVLDIGCAEGVFCARAAECGLYAVGVDSDDESIRIARNTHSGDTAAFRAQEITPETVSDLPESDIVLFLTVHHHWVSAFGFESAAEMIRMLCEKSDLFVYEPPGDRYLGSETNDLPQPLSEYYADLFREIVGDDARIVATYTSSYTGAGREDPIFIVDTSER
ncbi:hypothetical protein EL22_23590 [Halostagnicola sp. A56]|uniref:class I SAM-dependent methyltransferase n=1 Tax=Halostagnicola sp. A56 TaxID=1495067 RepID=UPI0004A1766E|nr:class I SAM-dependent methyltransferase [Halostagnicola sp. A56]KDE60420.1 hypothetical protein EL22_23590 [Halostagnicola sp. A56]